ncbi:MAG: recombination mediator RecR [Patescibacteria group bacterium]|nr:recombination mediator RecR [Patescibacteria group bacterium]
MLKLPSSLQKLINELSKLPGIGPKTAQRLAFYLMKKDGVDVGNLAEAVGQVKNGIVFCSVCHVMSETDPCSICGDRKRDGSVVCVVEESLDALAIDRAGQFPGVFHVLGGVLNPLEGVGPENLQVDSLLERIKRPESGIQEIIIATNPSLEGETTALHIAKLLKDFPAVKVTRIARGLPTGGDLEYADDITLMRAMEGRREI